MNLERMKHLQRVAQATKPETLDMSLWGIKLYPKQMPGFMTPPGVASCGTTFCMIGHCGQDPWFRSQGLVSRFDDPSDTRASVLVNDYPRSGEVELAEFFDLSMEQVRNLFYSFYYPPDMRTGIAARREFLHRLIDIMGDDYDTH